MQNTVDKKNTIEIKNSETAWHPTQPWKLLQDLENRSLEERHIMQKKRIMYCLFFVSNLKQFVLKHNLENIFPSENFKEFGIEHVIERINDYLGDISKCISAWKKDGKKCSNIDKKQCEEHLKTLYDLLHRFDSIRVKYKKYDVLSKTIQHMCSYDITESDEKDIQKIIRQNQKDVPLNLQNEYSMNGIYSLRAELLNISLRASALFSEYLSYYGYVTKQKKEDTCEDVAKLLKIKDDKILYTYINSRKKTKYRDYEEKKILYKVFLAEQLQEFVKNHWSTFSSHFKCELKDLNKIDIKDVTRSINNYLKTISKFITDCSKGKKQRSDIDNNDISVLHALKDGFNTKKEELEILFKNCSRSAEEQDTYDRILQKTKNLSSDLKDVYVQDRKDLLPSKLTNLSIKAYNLFYKYLICYMYLTKMSMTDMSIEVVGLLDTDNSESLISSLYGFINRNLKEDKKQDGLVGEKRESFDTAKKLELTERNKKILDKRDKESECDWWTPNRICQESKYKEPTTVEEIMKALLSEEEGISEQRRICELNLSFEKKELQYDEQSQGSPPYITKKYGALEEEQEDLSNEMCAELKKESLQKVYKEQQNKKLCCDNTPGKFFELTKSGSWKFDSSYVNSEDLDCESFNVSVVGE